MFMINSQKMVCFDIIKYFIISSGFFFVTETVKCFKIFLAKFYISTQQEESMQINISSENENSLFEVVIS